MVVIKHSQKNKLIAHIKPLLLLVIFMSLLNACSNSIKSDKPIISVSILPQKYFVEKIAGDHFEINVLIPPGSSPATYDPTPAQIVELAKSQVYFKIGHIEFEKNWLDKFSGQYPKLYIVDNSKGIRLIENKYYHEDHGHHHGFVEPHIWMCPDNAKLIAKSIYEALLKLDASNQASFTNNYKQFLSEIEELNQDISKQLQNAKSRSFIIYHPALTYFANTYNLQQLPIEVEGKNPSAFHIKQIIDTAKSRNIKIVFIQKQFDQEKAKTIAHEIGGTVIQIDPLDYNWADQLLTISAAFTTNFNSIKDE